MPLVQFDAAAGLQGVASDTCALPAARRKSSLTARLASGGQERGPVGERRVELRFVVVTRGCQD